MPARSSCSGKLRLSLRREKSRLKRFMLLAVNGWKAERLRYPEARIRIGAVEPAIVGAELGLCRFKGGMFQLAAGFFFQTCSLHVKVMLRGNAQRTVQDLPAYPEAVVAHSCQCAG